MAFRISPRYCFSGIWTPLFGFIFIETVESHAVSFKQSIIVFKLTNDHSIYKFTSKLWNIFNISTVFVYFFKRLCLVRFHKK
jgi:hypothetical protein